MTTGRNVRASVAQIGHCSKVQMDLHYRYSWPPESKVPRSLSPHCKGWGRCGEIQNKSVKSYRLAVRAITKEELLTGVVTISVVECEHYKRWHKETKKHQIRIVRTAQEGPEKRKGRAVLVKRYFCIKWNLPELVMV